MAHEFAERGTVSTPRQLGTVNPFCPVCLIETKIEHTPTGYKIYVCQKCDRYWHPDEVPP